MYERRSHFTILADSINEECEDPKALHDILFKKIHNCSKVLSDVARVVRVEETFHELTVHNRSGKDRGREYSQWRARMVFCPLEGKRKSDVESVVRASCKNVRFNT